MPQLDDRPIAETYKNQFSLKYHCSLIILFRSEVIMLQFYKCLFILKTLKRIRKILVLRLILHSKRWYLQFRQMHVATLVTLKSIFGRIIFKRIVVLCIARKELAHKRAECTVTTLYPLSTYYWSARPYLNIVTTCCCVYVFRKYRIKYEMTF